VRLVLRVAAVGCSAALAATCVFFGIASIQLGQECDPEGWSIGMIGDWPSIKNCHSAIVFGIFLIAAGALAVAALIVVLIHLRRSSRNRP
jgi:hypothetical protein